jgi:Spy/CpxP family protein refolding chaperone
LGVTLAGGVALAAWAATGDLALPRPAPVLPRGPMLDRLLDEAQASPTQRAQAHQIFDAADAGLRQQQGAERADRLRLVQLFSQPDVDAAAVEAVRRDIGQRQELESRRTTQALLDVALVLNAGQRRIIARRLVDVPPDLAGLPPSPAALAANE